MLCRDVCPLEGSHEGFGRADVPGRRSGGKDENRLGTSGSVV